MFTTIGCSKDNDNELNPKEDTPLNDNKETYEFININIEDLYFVGEESDITVSIYPERKIDKITYKSNNEEILSVDNNGHLKALKEGDVLITITIDSKEEKRIVKVEEDEVFTALNDNQVTQQEYDELSRRILAREEEAKEHGFSSYKEYLEYLMNQDRMEYLKSVEEKQEATRRISESLGLSIENYICLQMYNDTYEKMEERANKYGLSIEFDSYNKNEFGYYPIRKIIDYKKLNRLDVITSYLDNKLGYCHSDYTINCPTNMGMIKNSDGTYDYSYGAHYKSVVVFNNYGYEVDNKIWNKIQETLPEIDYYLSAYDYIVDNINIDISTYSIHCYLINIAFQMEFSGFDEEELETLTKYMNDYEKMVGKHEKN